MVRQSADPGKNPGSLRRGAELSSLPDVMGGEVQASNVVRPFKIGKPW